MFQLREPASRHNMPWRPDGAWRRRRRSNPSTAARGALRVLRSGTCGQRPATVMR